MVHITENGKVFLILEGKSYKPRRYVGHIEGDTFHCFRDPEKHLFRRMNSYGFSYELMRNGLFLWVVVHQPDGSELTTTRRRILQLGEILNYSGRRLEMQIFLSLDLFGKEDDIPDVEPEQSEPSPDCPTDPSPFPGDEDAPPEREPDLFGGDL